MQQWLNDHVYNIPFFGFFLHSLGDMIVGIFDFLKNLVQIIVTIPPEFTYGLNGTFALWNLFRYVSIALLVLFVTIGGMQMMIGRATGIMYVPPSEFLPRVLMAFLACNMSFLICKTIIDLSNTMDSQVLFFAGRFVGTQISGGVQSGASAGNISTFVGVSFTAALGVIVGILAPNPFGIIIVLAGIAFFFTLVLKACSRLVLINVLIALSPLAIVAWILPQTRQWTSLWFNLFITSVIEVFLQATAVSVSLMILFSSGATAGNLPIRVVIVIFGFSLMLHIPKLLARVGGAGDHGSRLAPTALLGSVISYGIIRSIGGNLLGTGSRAADLSSRDRDGGDNDTGDGGTQSGSGDDNNSGGGGTQSGSGSSSGDGTRKGDSTASPKAGSSTKASGSSGTGARGNSPGNKARGNNNGPKPDNGRKTSKRSGRDRRRGTPQAFDPLVDGIIDLDLI